MSIHEPIVEQDSLLENEQIQNFIHYDAKHKRQLSFQKTSLTLYPV